MSSKNTPSSKSLARGSLIAALDVGSFKTACFIAQVVDDAGNFEIIGASNIPSSGITDGTLTDTTKAEKCVRQAVHTAENMAASAMKGYPLREVIVNLSGVHAKSHGRCVDLQIAGHKIAQADIDRALGKAQESILSPHYELVHTIPANYRIDGQNNIVKPIDMHGDEMSVDIHMITGDITALRNLADVIGRSHLDISAFCAAGYAAGLSSLVEDEKDLGCTVIDIGAGITSIAVFQNNACIYHDFVPLGGRHLTNDIARGITTSVDNAERIKKMYGSAMASHTDENELIDVPRLGEEDEEGRQPNHIPRSLIVGIIQPRVEEIFEMVRGKLNDCGLGSSLGRRVVLTGGGSQLSGIKDLAEHVLDKHVRLGQPLNTKGLPEAISGSAFATTMGLLHYVAHHSDEMPSQIMNRANPVGFMAKAKHWVRENW